MKVKHSISGHAKNYNLENNIPERISISKISSETYGAGKGIGEKISDSIKKNEYDRERHRESKANRVVSENEL